MCRSLLTATPEQPGWRHLLRSACLLTRKTVSNDYNERRSRKLSSGYNAVAGVAGRSNRARRTEHVGDDRRAVDIEPLLRCANSDSEDVQSACQETGSDAMIATAPAAKIRKHA